jgi:CheY-like chemotaxis protein
MRLRPSHFCWCSVTSVEWCGEERFLPKSQLVGAHLPELRRYARALTGSQESGDAYVARTVETLIAQPELITDAIRARTDLFRAFSKIWNSVPLNGSTTPVETSVADHRLEQISPLPRQAFLLVSLELLSEDDAAYILDCNTQEIRDLIDQCGKEIADQIATNILIIEDEALIAMDLKSVVENLGHKVVGVARTRTETLNLAKQKEPGLILADIQLADGSSGLDAVNDLLTAFEVPVVFITAYPERFLTGTRPEPTFLIAKPYRPAVVSAIVSQALFFQQNARAPDAAA